jgi:hypothetical protein
MRLERTWILIALLRQHCDTNVAGVVRRYNNP